MNQQTFICDLDLSSLTATQRGFLIDKGVTWLASVLDSAIVQEHAQSREAWQRSEWLARRVEDLPLTAYQVRILIAEGCESVAQLCDRTRLELLKLPNLGTKSVNQIERVLLDCNLKLRGR